MTDFTGEIARVTFAVLYPDAQVEECNVNYAVTAATGSQDSRAALGAALNTIWATYCAATLNATSTYYGYKVSIQNSTPPPAPVEVVLNTAGVLTGGPVPSQARPLISWQTLSAGRKYRGRNFLFTPDYSMVKATNGLPATALLAAMATLGVSSLSPQAFIGGGGTTTWNLCIAHRPKKPVPPALPGPWTYTQCTTYIARPEFATQWKSGSTGRQNAAPW